MSPELIAKMLKSFGLDPAEFTKYFADLQNTMKYFDQQIKTLVASNAELISVNAKLASQIEQLRQQNDTRFDLLQSMIEDYQDGKRNGPGDGTGIRPN